MFLHLLAILDTQFIFSLSCFPSENTENMSRIIASSQCNNRYSSSGVICPPGISKIWTLGLSFANMFYILYQGHPKNPKFIMSIVPKISRFLYYYVLSSVVYLYCQSRMFIRNIILTFLEYHSFVI